MEQQSKPKVGAGVGVILRRDGKVLLGRRHEDYRRATSDLRGEGTWTLPGGKLEYGESFEEGAIRETLEETGIRIDRIVVIAVNNDKNEHAHFVTLGLLAEEFSGEPKVMEPDKIVEWRWFGLDELPRPIYFPSEKLLENYRKGEFYIPGNVS